MTNRINGIKCIRLQLYHDKVGHPLARFCYSRVLFECCGRVDRVVELHLFATEGTRWAG